jgi:hypothetical protein
VAYVTGLITTWSICAAVLARLDAQRVRPVAQI